MDGWMDGWMDRWMDGYKNVMTKWYSYPNSHLEGEMVLTI